MAPVIVELALLRTYDDVVVLGRARVQEAVHFTNACFPADHNELGCKNQVNRVVDVKVVLLLDEKSRTLVGPFFSMAPMVETSSQRLQCKATQKFSFLASKSSFLKRDRTYSSVQCSSHAFWPKSGRWSMLTPPEKIKKYNIIFFPLVVSNRVGSRKAASHGQQPDAPAVEPWDSEGDLRMLESGVTLLDDAPLQRFHRQLLCHEVLGHCGRALTSKPSKAAKQANTGEFHLCNLSHFPIFGCEK